MKYIVVLIFIAVVAFGITGKLKTDEPLVSMYVTWVTTLVAINILVSIFIYMFTHSVKNSTGNEGVKGKVGRRGPEGKSAYCNFCDSQLE